MDGTDAIEGALLDRATTAPPTGAAALKRDCARRRKTSAHRRRTHRETDCSVAAGGVTVKVAFWLTPPSVPEIVTFVEELTNFALTGNVAVLAPGATVTVAGTVAAAVLLLDSVNTAPLVATAFSVTVPVDAPPLATLVGFSVSDAIDVVFVAPWLTVTNARLTMLPPNPSPTVTVIVTTVVAATFGGLNVTVEPEPVIRPASAVHV